MVVHAYYRHLWPGLHLQLGNLQVPFDLFASVPDHDLGERIEHDRPGAQVVVVENRGHDVGPFHTLVKGGALREYDAVLKLHTKLSPHRVDGDQWRTALWHGLLSDPPSAAQLARHVAHEPGAGGVVPAGNILPFGPDDLNWWPTRSLLQQDRRGRSAVRRSGQHSFPAGSMYWLSRSAVRALERLPSPLLLLDDRRLDGTGSHVLERLVGVALHRAGLSLVTTESVLSREHLDLSLAGRPPARPAPPRAEPRPR